MKILVTGGGGFVGGAIVRALLARGDNVIAFDTHFSRHSAASEELLRVPVDITDMAAVAQAMVRHKIDAVIHAAAVVGVLTSIGSPLNVVRVNIEGSLNVFEAMRLAGVKRCVHISSEETYGAFQADKIDENHPQNPVYPYGISKLTVEHLGRTYGEVHGIEVLNVSTCSVYGVGLPRARIPKNIVEAALAGRKLHVPSGAETAIDHTYIGDTVSSTVAILDHPGHRFDAYNIASGRSVTLGEIAAIVRESIPGAELTIGPGPARHGDQVEMVRKGALDVSRAEAEFGWRPQYDIRSGLAAYIGALRRISAQEGS
ncbi:MAG: NAD-dependent epimerase/dehydratase family protein [Betaproteobacteria bacterium]|nr:NAD-dependent epimerase/dehydratase family protein [Betaproteobacteria bacterium]